MTVKGGCANVRDVATGKRRVSMRRTSTFYPLYVATPLNQQVTYKACPDHITKGALTLMLKHRMLRRQMFGCHAL